MLLAIFRAIENAISSKEWQEQIKCYRKTLHSVTYVVRKSSNTHLRFYVID